MTNQINALSPEIQGLVLVRVRSQIEFIKEHTKPSLFNLIFGNPAENVIKSLRIELARWGINDV